MQLLNRIKAEIKDKCLSYEKTIKSITYLSLSLSPSPSLFSSSASLELPVSIEFYID